MLCGNLQDSVRFRGFIAKGYGPLLGPKYFRPYERWDPNFGNLPYDDAFR